MLRIAPTLLMTLLLAGAAHASSITTVSASLSPEITCTQTDPTESSCTEGNPDGYGADPPTPYATADASVTAPGVLSLYTYAYGTGIEYVAGQSFASASFSYMIEVTGGVGQVLVAPGGFVSCSEVSSLEGSQACPEPTVLLGGSLSDYLATYGVPFSFTGSAYAYAQPDYNESWVGTASIEYGVSSLILVDPTTDLQIYSGTVIVLPDTPEPGTGVTGALGLALLALRCRRVNLRRAIRIRNDDRGDAAL